MPKVTIDIRQATNMLKKLSDRKTYDEIITVFLARELALAMELAPEDTGYMEESIVIRSGAEEGTYELFIDGRKVPYAIFNEWGTYKMPVGSPESPLPITSTSGKAAYRPFMRPVAFRAIDELQKVINEFWNKIK